MLFGNVVLSLTLSHLSICLSLSLSSATFTLVAFGFGDGDLGIDCNIEHSTRCDSVFKARAATFTTLVWFSLILAWELVDRELSFFHPSVIKNTPKNRFLFAINIFGFFSVFPLLYIPGLNDIVFLHRGISWEWGIVFVSTVLFLGGVELYKWMKRIYFRRTIPNVAAEVDEEAKVGSEDSQAPSRSNSEKVAA